MTYQGEFTIVGPDGTEVQLTGTLVKSVRNGLQSWRGSAVADPTDAAQIPRREARLRLPDGSEGDVLVQGTSDSIDQHRGRSLSLTLVGSGAAPF